jgi:DNA-directed RNA polymerase specialized sigma24 family protein
MAIIFRYTRLTRGYNTPFFDSLIDVASVLALEPTDEKSDLDPESQGLLPSDSSSHQQWKPTPEALDKLLATLSPDRDKAGEEYEIIRRKLHRFFEWRGCDAGDRLTDKTFDRVMRRLDEGQVISKSRAYIYSVARFIYKEWLREQQPTVLIDETVAGLVDPEPLDSERDDPRVHCFDGCLAGLSSEDQEIILEYYTGEKREKIERRMQLALKYNLSLNALRIRVHRIRKDLEECVKRCLSDIVT